MYAVVSSGGKQYRVEAGSLLTLERLDGEPGASLTFDRILLIGDGDEVTIGTPVVPGASVSATVLGEALGPKLVIFKFKQKVKYRRRNGHRQHLTRVRIDTINPTGVKKAATAPRAKPVMAEATTTAPRAKAAAAGPRTARARTAKAEGTKAEGTKAEATKAEPTVARPKARRPAKPKAQE